MKKDVIWLCLGLIATGLLNQFIPTIGHLDSEWIFGLIYLISYWIISRIFKKVSSFLKRVYDRLLEKLVKDVKEQLNKTA